MSPVANPDPFPNDWEEVKKTPTHRFVSPPVEEVLRRSSSWDLPFPYEYIVRVQNKITHKVIEKAYKDRSAAKRFIERQITDEHVVTFYDNESIRTFGDEDGDQ
jgi:hypothetical protein